MKLFLLDDIIILWNILLGGIMKNTKKKYSKAELKKRVTKRKARKAMIIMFFILAVMITAALKVSYFNLEFINIGKNQLLTEDEIFKYISVNKGDNIFLVNKKQVIDEIKKHPYIKDAKVTRVLPNKLNIDIEERKGAFISSYENKRYILDETLNILQLAEENKDYELIELRGLNFKDINPGDKAKGYEGVEKFVLDINELMMRNLTDIKVTAINLEQKNNIRLYVGDFEIKIGNEEEIKDKLNKAFNIMLQDSTLGKSKGYIDVSFKGNPVVHRGE